MKTIALRCTNCGAPLPKPQPGNEWIRCEYCGFLNKVVDATYYIEKLRSEIKKWIKELLPSGDVFTQVRDNEARHQLFQSIIKPKVLIARANMRARYLQYLSKPVTPIPPPDPPKEKPKFFFEEALKIQAIKDFAVLEEDSKLVIETIVYGNTTGYLLNALRALSRYDIKSALKNIDEALSQIPEEPSFSLVKRRFNAIKTVLKSLEQLYDRNTSASLDLAKNGLELYTHLIKRAEYSQEPGASKWILEVEKTAAKLVYYLSDASHKFYMAGRDPLEIVKWVEAFMPIFKRLKDTYRIHIQDLVEIIHNLRRLAYSKTGSPEISVVPGRGHLYVPFHVVECRFSYIKGFIFKKGGEGKLTILVASIPVENPVFDVLSLYIGRPPSPDRVEDAPGHSLVRDIVSSARTSSLPEEVKAFPPFISSVLAEKLVDEYIEIANNKYWGNMTFASSRALDLVYLPFNISGQRKLVNEKGISLNLTVGLNSLVELTI